MAVRWSVGPFHFDVKTLLLPPGEARETVAYSGPLDDDEEIKTFITAEKMPLTIEFSQGNSDKIFNSGIKKQVIFWSKAADFTADSKVFAALKVCKLQLCICNG